MRVVIPALGTRGDVRPYVALGAGLRRAGHDVLFATLEEFRPLVDAEGLEFQALPGSSSAIVGWDPMDVSTRRPLHHVRLIHSVMSGLVGLVDPQALLDRWRGADGVVFSGTTTFGHFNAQQLGVPSIMAAYGPVVATRAFPQPIFAPGLRLGGWANYASWLIGEHLQKQTFQEPLRPRARTAVGLPALPWPGGGRSADRWPPIPVLHGFSPALLPRPRDWPDHVEVTGWWTSDEGEEHPLPEEVERFLQAGDPPLYIGFGSMPLPAPERVGEIIAGALRRTGQRAIVGGLSSEALRGAAAGQVLTVDFVPFGPLFARVSAVVHHGGSGTIALGLRAGRPTLVVPFIFDQFFWGRCVEAAGGGPRPLPFAALSAERLAGALERLAAPGLQATARGLGERMRDEDGVARAVAAIERGLT